MKKLPKIFKNNITKQLNNNNKVFYSGKTEDRSINNIDDLFKQNEIYRTDITIYLKDGSIVKKTIIGRSIKHLITLDNELIPIDNIQKITK